MITTKNPNTISSSCFPKRLATTISISFFLTLCTFASRINDLTGFQFHHDGKNGNEAFSSCHSPFSASYARFHPIANVPFERPRRSANRLFFSVTSPQQQQRQQEEEEDILQNEETNQVDDYENEDEMNDVVDIDEITSMLLDTDTYPPGNLPSDVLDQACYVMDQWAKCGMGEEGAEIVERILERVIEEEKEGNVHAGKVLSTKLYTVAIDAWARSSNNNTPQSAPKAESLLNKLRTTYTQTQNPNLEPNTILYNAVINAFAKQGTIQSAERAESLLDEMEEDNLQPNTISFNAVLNAWSKCRQYDRSLQLLEKMIVCSYSDVNVEPDQISFNTVINALSKAGTAEYANKARSILQKMVNLNIKPDACTYSFCINCWVKSGSAEAADEAEALLNHMLEQGVRQDDFVFNSVINAVSRFGGANRAEELLTRMEKMYEEGEIKAKPSTRGYNSVLHAYAKSGDVDKAEAILLKMEEISSDLGDETVKPDVFSYSAVIHALSKSAIEGQRQKYHLSKRRGERSGFSSSGGHEKRGPGSAARAERILSKLEKIYANGDEDFRPNTITYTSVIDAYAQSGDAPSAERIFQQMESAYLGGNEEAKPNVHSWNTVINAWSKSRSLEGAERARLILDRMEELHKNGMYDAAPNVVSYSTVMKAYAALGDARNAQDIFDRMNDAYQSGNTAAKPNKISYTTLIDAWLKSRIDSSKASQKAQDILQQMETAYRNGDLNSKPNTINYTTVIDSISKSKDPIAGTKAIALLDQMEQLYNHHQDPDVRPNVMTYTAVINACAKSQQTGKAEKAHDILRRMERDYKSGNVDAMPNVFTYSSVMNACAYTIGDDEFEKNYALRIISSTFKELKDSEYGDPNHITYGTFLRACINLIPDIHRRASAVKTVFKKCCEDGQVSELVLRQLRDAVREDVFRRLVGEKVMGKDGSVKYADLPKEWTRNASDAKKKKYKKNFRHRSRNNYANIRR